MAKLLVTIDRFEADKAVLILPDKGQLIIDRSYLAAEIKEGDILELNFCLDRRAKSAAEKQARKLLGGLNTKA